MLCLHRNVYCDYLRCDNIYVLTDRAGCCVNLVTGKEKALVFSLGGFFILSRYGLLPTYV